MVILHAVFVFSLSRVLPALGALYFFSPLVLSLNLEEK